ncbi:phage tail tape measure protein [Candidatus Pacearchaeota archaeon]|nr:phage tail tape measure protein [Candidatus Pacearchaeota archaeon]
MSDIILRLGVEFRPRDIDARAIRTAITKAIGAATVSIERVSFSRGAKENLKRSFAGIAFQVDKARFTTQARRGLQAGFGTIRFSLQRALFGRTSKSELQQSFKRIPFTIGTVQLAAAAIRQLQSQLSSVSVQPGGRRGGGRGAGDALAAQARREFEQRQRPATIGAADIKQINPSRIRAIADEFRNLASATAQLSGVSRQLQALRNVQQSFSDLGQRADVTSGNLRNTATRLQEVQSRATQTRAALEQMQLARRAAEAGALARENLKLVQSEDAATRSTRQLTNVLRQSGVSAEVFGARLGQITARFAQYLISVRAIIAAQQLFRATLDSIVRFDSVIQDLNKVLNETPANLAKVSEGLFDVAQNTSRSFDEVSTAFGTFIRAGLGVEDALKRAEAALIATNISELGATDSTRLITSALQVFKDSLEDPIEFLDRLSVVADNAATTAGQVGQAFLRSASAARESGVGFEQLLGIIASTLEETQLQAGTVGTALKTIFTRAVSNADKLREVSNQFGANVRAGDDLITVLGKLAKVFDKTSIAQRNQIGLLVGGRRQFNIFAGILNNFEKSQELVAKQANASGIALRKNEEELKTLAAQGRKVVATFDELVNAIAGTNEGAEGAGRLRGVMENVLTTTNTMLQVVVDLTSRFNQAGAVVQTISGALRGAVAAGLLAIGGRLISGLVNGFRQFLQVGGLIKNTLEQLGAGVTTVEGKERGVNTQLERQLGLRQRIAQVAQTPVRQVIGQAGAAVSNARQAGGIRGLTGRGLERLTGSLNNLRDTLRNPRQAIGGFFAGQGAGVDRQAQVAGQRRLAGIVALGAIANVAGGQLDKLAASLKSGKTAGDSFAAAGIDASSQALQLGVTFGALTGSIKFGILAGLIAAGGALIRFAQEEEAIGKAAVDFQTALASAGNFTVQQAREGFGGDILRNAVENISGPLDSLDPNAILNLDTIIARSGDLIESAGQSLSNSLIQSKDAIDDFGQRISEFAAQSQFRRDIAEARRGARTTDIRAEFDIGGLEGLQDITDPLSKALAISEDITRGLDRSASSADRLATAFAAGKDLLQTQVGTIDDIINDFDLETETRAHSQLIGEQIIGDLEKEVRILEAATGEQESFSAALQRSVDKVAKLEEGAKRVAAAGGALADTATGRNEAEITAELEKQAELKAKLLSREQQIENLSANIQRLREQQTRVTQELAREDANIRDRLGEIQKLFIDIVAQSKESVSAAKGETREILDRNGALKTQAEIQRGLLDVERNRGTLLEQFEARQGAVLQAAAGDVDRQIAAAQRNVEGLQTLANQIRAASPEVAASLDEAAGQLSSAIADQEEALRAEVQLRLQPELEAQAFEELKRNEEQLREIRLQGIDATLEAEQRRFNAQQSLIERLGSFIESVDTGAIGGGAQGGGSVRRLRQAIQEELEGISDDARQTFGDVGSILVRNTLQAFERVAERGREIIQSITEIRDPVQRQRRAAQAEQEILQRNEEAVQFIRERVLAQLKTSADRASSSEEALSEARDKATEATNKVKSAQDSLVQAEEQVAAAQERLSASLQANNDAQVTYNVTLATARINVLNSTGAFRSFGEQIAALSTISATAAQVVGASETKILEIRANVAQEALNIFQNQFNAIQSLGSRAATATLDQITDLQTGLGVAQQVLAGEGGDISPELLQLASQFTDLFPGLERAISEIGLERLGIDPSVLEDIQDRQLELAQITADSAQVGVVQAEKQVALSQEAVNEAREQKDIAKELLSSAQEQEAKAQENLIAAQRTAQVSQAGFSRQATLAGNTLAQLSGSFVLGQRSLEVLAASRNLQREAVDQLISLNNKLSSATVTSGGSTSNNASGSLSSSEINGLLGAAQREKRGMPPGSRLMLANTSEVVLTRTQARGMGMRPVPKANAQDGNAATTGSLESMAIALNAAVNTLISRLDGAALVEQNITVQVDSNRTLDIRGLDSIDGAISNALQERFGTFASRDEQAAIKEMIVGLLTRLNEAQIVNSRGF